MTKHEADVPISDEEYADAKAWLQTEYPDSYRDMDAPFQWLPGSYVVEPEAYTDIPYRSGSQTPEARAKWEQAARKAVQSYLAENGVPPAQPLTTQRSHILGRLRSVFGR